LIRIFFELYGIVSGSSIRATVVLALAMSEILAPDVCRMGRPDDQQIVLGRRLQLDSLSTLR
jgi:hypothetical protein